MLHRTPARRAIVTLTPLIDVVFILLVFFMLASSYLDWRTIDLGAPVATGAGGGGAAVLVEIRANDVRLSGESLDIESVATRIVELASRRPGLEVLVRPEPGVTLQRTVHVIDALDAAGVSGLSFAHAPAQ